VAVTGKPAPRADTGSASDALYIQDNAGGLSGDLDLQGITQRPQMCPQKTQLWVDSAIASIVLVDEKGLSHTIAVAPGTPIVLTRPMKTITHSGTGDVNCAFEWFDIGSCPINP